VYRDDAWMVERGRGLGFLDKSPLAVRIRNLLRRQDFYRHKTIEVQIASLVDHAHAARAQLPDDLVVQDDFANQAEYLHRQFTTLQ